jgi:hypothetical protein
MTVPDILDGAFKLYKANARSLILITAAFIVPVQLAAAFLQRDTFGGRSIVAVFNDPTAVQNSSSSGANVWASVFVTIASVLVLPFIAGAVSRVVAGSYLGQEIEPGDALRVVGRRGWALLAAWVLVHLAELVSGVFCIIPGVLVMAFFVAVAPAIVVEELGPIRGMRRSFRLIKRRYWGVLGIALLTALLSTVIGSALGFIPQTAAFIVGLRWGWLLLAAGAIISGVLTTPFVAIVSTLVYFDGRIRWEGFDLAVMAGDLARRGSPYGGAGA